MLAVLDRDPESLRDGDPLPAGWHWLFCNAVHRRSTWAEDGHTRRGGFLPPIEFPRRMWAGGSLCFHRELRIGETLTRRSKVAAIDEKEGRSGRFVLVTVAHDWSVDGELAIEEQQILAYRQADESGPRTQQPFEREEWRETFTPDEVVLFYFSALTMNGHRIHYDRRFATEREGYPGLLVHAPFTALLLLDAVQRRRGHPVRFDYRAVRPLFSGQPIVLAGRQAAVHHEVAALAPDGSIAMKASAAYA